MERLLESESAVCSADILERHRRNPRDLEQLAHEWWSALALRRPELFDLPVDPGRLTGLAMALRYAQAQTPKLVGPLSLSARERLALQQMRARLIVWSELPSWTDFEHLVFAPNCAQLAETYALSSRSGIAFTFHQHLDKLALYPQTAIEQYRRHGGLASLVSLLLHEEFHLAAAASLFPGISGPRTTAARQHFEQGACLIEQISYLTVSSGLVPETDELAAYLEQHYPETALFTTELDEPSVPDLVSAAVTETLRTLDAPALVCRAPDLLTGSAPKSAGRAVCSCGEKTGRTPPPWC
jgi:hypothetical protein